MDNPRPENNNEEEKQNEDNSSEEEYSYKEIWNINIRDEENFWQYLINKGLIYKPDICPICNLGGLEKKTTPDNNILNPFYYRCNFSKCGKDILFVIFLYLNYSKNGLQVWFIKLLKNLF